MSALENILHFPTQARRQSNVNSWKWNELEEDVLDELPHACQIIYLRVMRKHMDYSTGIVGRVRRISYEQIKERLRYTPPPQSREKPVEYSTDQVKKLIRKLVNAGLLERLHDTSKGVQPMEFRLPLACTDADSQGHDRATVTGPRENPHGYGAGEHNRATTGPRKNASQGHPSGSGNNSLPTVESVAAPKSKRRQWGEEIDHELAEWIASVVDGLPGGSEKRNMTSWANTVRLMREQDGRDPAHIRRLFEWASQHEFWQANILSPAKLRKQWKTLALQFNRDRNGARHENIQSADQRRAEQDRIAARLADPNDSGWIDGLFDEEDAASGAGEPSVYPAGGDLSEDVAHGVQHGPDADASQAGGGYIDGEVVSPANDTGRGCSGGANQGRGRGMAAERSQPGEVIEAEARGFWDA